MNKIVYSPESKKDLDEIYDYIHDNLKNFLAAKNTIALLEYFIKDRIIFNSCFIKMTSYFSI